MLNYTYLPLWTITLKGCTESKQIPFYVCKLISTFHTVTVAKDLHFFMLKQLLNQQQVLNV
jgi:hypothetical protein